VGDAGQHHLQPLIAHAQRLPHLLEGAGQRADLVASLHLDVDGSAELAASDALRRAGQPAQRAGS
jgi:hypothetical protein